MSDKAKRTAVAQARARYHRAERDLERVRAELSRRDEDMRLAAGELLIPIPEPGSDMARLLLANMQLRRERDELLAERAEARRAVSRTPGGSLRAIVAALTKCAPYGDIEGTGYVICALCDTTQIDSAVDAEELQAHAPQCPWRLARELTERGG